MVDLFKLILLDLAFVDFHSRPARVWGLNYFGAKGRRCHSVVRHICKTLSFFRLLLADKKIEVWNISIRFMIHFVKFH